MRMKTYQVVVFLAVGRALIASFALGQGREAVPNTEKKRNGICIQECGESNRDTVALQSIIPDSFRMPVAVHPTKDPLSSSEAWVNQTLIPAQFNKSETISAEEQLRIEQQKVNEDLYRKQSVPGYYEKAREDFRKDYQRRMEEKTLSIQTPENQDK